MVYVGRTRAWDTCRRMQIIRECVRTLRGYWKAGTVDDYSRDEIMSIVISPGSHRGQIRGFSC